MQLLGMSAIITSLSGYPDEALVLVLSVKRLISMPHWLPTFSQRQHPVGHLSQ